MTDVVVAGSGRCGLHAARILAEAGLKVTVVERLPETGGQEPERDARKLEKAARRAGAEFKLGTLVVSYRDAVVETLGIDGAWSAEIRALVLATGTRPRTRAELGISGDRGAGVLPGSAAVHFLDSGLLMGYHPVVIGHGELARHLGEALLDKGARTVTSVADQPRIGHWPSQIRQIDNARVAAVHGFPHLRSATVVSESDTERVDTDAILLACGRVPMRNVEGAVAPGPTIADCFSTDDPKTDAEALRAARSAALRVHQIVS
ncbi:FAD-dependent oxidoreductase [Mycolicibacterium sp.]|uniref:FAD-dependent oxidoreductase n=1 Tax=Mycolicibacterium sp. TaxID=2320850 RepID=UPI003D11404D